MEISLQRAALGLLFGVLAGVVLAVTAGLSRFGEYLLDGTLQVKRAIPSLALLPLFILWLGIGEQMKVTVIALGVAVVVYVNTYASLTGIDAKYVELAESLDLSRWQFVRRVVVPGALPGFFVGLRLGVTSAWLGLVVVEQINATRGLGYMMFQAQQYAQSDVIIVGLVFYGVFGLRLRRGGTVGREEGAVMATHTGGLTAVRDDTAAGGIAVRTTGLVRGFGDRHGAQGTRSHPRPGRVHRPARAQRLRQVHAAAGRRPARPRRQPAPAD